MWGSSDDEFRRRAPAGRCAISSNAAGPEPVHSELEVGIGGPCVAGDGFAKHWRLSGGAVFEEGLEACGAGEGVDSGCGAWSCLSARDWLNSGGGIDFDSRRERPWKQAAIAANAPNVDIDETDADVRDNLVVRILSTGLDPWELC